MTPSELAAYTVLGENAGISPHSTNLGNFRNWFARTGATNSIPPLGLGQILSRKDKPFRNGLKNTVKLTRQVLSENRVFLDFYAHNKVISALNSDPSFQVPTSSRMWRIMSSKEYSNAHFFQQNLPFFHYIY